MAVIISTLSGEKVFKKDVVNIGTNPGCDIVINPGYDVLLTVQYNSAENKCVIMNTFQSDKVLFKGQPIKRVEVKNVCKLMFAGSEEFVSIRLLEEHQNTGSKTITSIGKEDLTEEDIKGLYGKMLTQLPKLNLKNKKKTWKMHVLQ